MLRKFLPQVTNFFEHFERLGALVIQASQELMVLASGQTNPAAQAARIKQIEHDADEVAHLSIDALHRTFITPIDRELVHSLVTRLDDIVDSIDAAASRIALYELTEMRPEVKDLAQTLSRAAAEISKALRLMRDLKYSDEIKQSCVAIYQYENDGDAILRAALVRLFKEEPNAVLIIKWKEIFERLEKACDRCEDVANLIQTIVIEAS